MTNGRRVVSPRCQMVLVLTVLAGCEQHSLPGRSDAGAEVRDSAGVLIVETDGSVARTALSWVISPSPVLEIGKVDGTEPYLFSAVTETARLSNGHLIVVDANSRELRLFREDGTWVRSFGGVGDGPGEFGSAPRLVPSLQHDSLLVYDPALRRFTVFTVGGDLIRTYGSLTLASIGGRFPGRISAPLGTIGANVVTLHTVSMTSGFPTEPNTVFHPSDPFEYRMTSPVTGESTELRSIEKTVNFVTPADELGQRSMWPMPLAVRPMAVVARERLLFNTGEDGEIHEIDGEATLRRIIRILEPPSEVSEADFTRFVEREIAFMRNPEGRVFVAEAYRMLPRPERLPVFQTLLVDQLGWLWAEAFRIDGSDGDRDWLVFDPEGRGRGKVALPPDIRIHQVGADFVLGVWRDTLGVEYVRLHELTRD